MPLTIVRKSISVPESVSNEFRHLENVLSRPQDKELELKLFQWDMQTNLHIERFYIKGNSGKIEHAHDTALLNNFFADQHVRTILKLPSFNRDTSSALMYHELKATVTTCAFFDKILESNIVSYGGVIRRCLDEYHNGISVGDQLKKMMIESDNDTDDFFTESERKEFMCHIFRSVVIGGSLSQPDENISPYISATKSMYKRLISVKKKPTDPNGLQITSRVYQVRCTDTSYSSLFSTTSPYHSCYVIVDPKKRLITAWYYPYRSFW
uniref:Cilia- and flagella-associated protein 300 n=1 Tax=Albugo laibachii Nc14 TaxID=890382 RepID=F0W9C9_9STRA|nr:conserved hypothetical protein [Albugo laibachii Nc14]CCA18386.1 conserved hypothetical protein [Albugo laibachii Nc14]|eukprot:CCA18386.1 conserved hypothetical protein [Albugo laibachii Nc14]